MLIQRLRYRLLAALAVTISIGLVATALFYVRQAEQAILAEQERAFHKVTEAVGSSLESIMVGGHAEVAAEFNRRLAKVGGSRRFAILRTDGRVAFQDNQTIDAVNEALGEKRFSRRAEPEALLQPIVNVKLRSFQEVLQGEEARSEVEITPLGERVTVFFDPIFTRKSCHRCHAGGERIRGVVVLESSFDAVEREMAAARVRGLVGLAIALALTMALTGYLLGRMLFAPIEDVTRAMRRVSKGDWAHGVPVQSRDEIGQMATNFNAMRERLRDTYLGMVAEQDKLTTILLAAREAVVVTDRNGSIVLVNPAAETILGKSAARIEAEGFVRLVDDQELMEGLLAGRRDAAAPLIYRGKALQVSASTIRDGYGEVIGSAALIRDVDDEVRLRDRLQKMARTDEMTGLYNRRHLDLRFAEELSRARDDGLPLAVMIFDVDHFKRFNDEHGHDAGDRVLKAVGRVVSETLRRYDVLGRYGGEEFVAVLPGLRGKDAALVAERLRADVEAMDVGGLRVTISIGIACTELIPTEDPDALLAVADAALYRAKHAGRNRVALAPATEVERAIAT